MGLHLTKIDAVFKHRVMWCAIAEILRQLEGFGLEVSLEKIKEDVIYTRFLKLHRPLASCFLCDYTVEVAPALHGSACDICPLMELSSSQKLSDCVGECLNGLFSVVCARISDCEFKKASKTALEIAFLPVIN